MKKSTWRLIRSGPGNAAWNMALDEAINRSCLEGFSPPTLRLYGWQQPSVTIGRFQKKTSPSPVSTSPESDFVRRITGGRAVRHGGDLTFSISVGRISPDRISAGAEQQDIPTRPREGFLAVAKLIQNAFRHFQIDLGWGRTPARTQNGHHNNHADCFSRMEAFELGFKGEKIFGCAQKRFKKGLLQQGTLRLEPLKWHLKRDQFLELERSLPLEIKAAFEDGLGVEFSTQELSRAEWNLAVRLEEFRYRNPDWNTHGKAINI